MSKTRLNAPAAWVDTLANYKARVVTRLEIKLYAYMGSDELETDSEIAVTLPNDVAEKNGKRKVLPFDLVEKSLEDLWEVAVAEVAKNHTVAVAKLAIFGWDQKTNESIKLDACATGGAIDCSGDKPRKGNFRSSFGNMAPDEMVTAIQDLAKVSSETAKENLALIQSSNETMRSTLENVVRCNGLYERAREVLVEAWTHEYDLKKVEIEERGRTERSQEMTKRFAMGMETFGPTIAQIFSDWAASRTGRDDPKSPPESPPGTEDKTSDERQAPEDTPPKTSQKSVLTGDVVASDSQEVEDAQTVSDPAKTDGAGSSQDG